MYYNKKRTKTIALLGTILLLGVCGCGAEESVQEEQNRGSVSGTVTEAAVQEGAEITEAVTQEPAEITQVEIEEEEGTAGAVKPTAAAEAQPGDMEDTEEEKPVDTGEEEPADAVETESTDTEKQEAMDVLKEMEPEELVVHILTNAAGVYYTSGGVGVPKLLGYVEDKDVAYFIMKKQKSPEALEFQGGSVYVGVLNPKTGELQQHYCYGNTISDAVMIEKEAGLYILYATECRDFGLHSGYGGVLLAKDGTLTLVWPLTPEGTYDDDYWNQHTARLNGETLERHKVIVTEVSPDDIAIRTEVELERTITLDEILAGAV